MRRMYNKRVARNEFVIVTNGETERCYFESLKKRIKSAYSVKVQCRNVDPLRLIQYAKSMNSEKTNQIWCVFDIDKFEEGLFLKVVDEAQKYGIHIAYSNVCFEVWLVSHFRQIENDVSEKNLEEIINKYLKEKSLNYDKPAEKVQNTYFVPLYRTAVENAKIVYQKKEKEHRELNGIPGMLKFWECKSSTTVFKLVEALELTD